MQLSYFVWGLLPAFLFFLALRAVFRKTVKVPKRESSGFFFSQAIFCSVALAIFIIVDQTIFEQLLDTVGLGWFHLGIARWVLYPVILFLMAGLQDLHKKYFAKPVDDKLKRNNF